MFVGSREGSQQALLEYRKCQRFPACNWSIRAVFSGRRLLWMWNAMVKLKMASLLVLLPNQEVPAFSCLYLIDLRRFHFQTSKLCWSSQQSPFLWERCESINYKQENDGTSCLASKSGGNDILGFTIVFRIPRHPLPEKTAGINRADIPCRA